MRQGIIRQKRGTGQEESAFEAWKSQEIEDISVSFIRHMAFDKQCIVTALEYEGMSGSNGVILKLSDRHTYQLKYLIPTQYGTLNGVPTET